MILLITITNSLLLLFNNINWLLYKFYSLIIKVYTTAQGHTTTFMNSKRLDWNNHMPVLPFQLFINHPPFFRISFKMVAFYLNNCDYDHNYYNHDFYKTVHYWHQGDWMKRSVMHNGHWRICWQGWWHNTDRVRLLP